MNPAAFEEAWQSRRISSGEHRHRRVGIILIGLGLGLMMIITFAGNDLRSGVGVGDGIVMLGAAFVVNSVFEKNRETSPPSSPAAPRDIITPGDMNSR
jgi:hypothetical protein